MNLVNYIYISYYKILFFRHLLLLLQETIKVKDISQKNDKNLKAVSNVEDIIKRLRKEHQETSNRHRYEVINCSRGLKDTNEKSEDIFDLIDLQKSEELEKDDQYTYDFYIPLKQNFDVSMLDNVVRFVFRLM